MPDPPQYVYVDVRVLFILMLLATGALQYLVVGAVKLVMRSRWFTAERKSKHDSKIVLLDDHRKEKNG